VNPCLDAGYRHNGAYETSTENDVDTAEECYWICKQDSQCIVRSDSQYENRVDLSFQIATYDRLSKTCSKQDIAAQASTRDFNNGYKMTVYSNCGIGKNFDDV